jgi:hypothetical protein
VIVAEADKVTIYDGDDPALPMWMVFNTGAGDILRNQTVSSLSASSGVLSVGGSNQVQAISFVADKATWFAANAAYGGDYNSLSERNSGTTQYFINTGAGLPIIVNNTVNDVAMTVLPDAPIDPATGLPVPTIAVATDGGVSVIKDDGTVVDSAASSAILIATTDEGVWWTTEFANQMYFATWTDVYAGDGFGDFVGSITAGLAAIDMLTRARSGIISTGDLLALGSNVEDGLMLHQPNYTDQSKGMSALLTSTYNTGWLPGDIKGAFLSDTDDTDLVGSGELVTNGTFDTDTSGWTDASEGTGSVSWDASGAISLNNPAASGTEEGLAYQIINTVVGVPYTLTLSKSGGGSITQIGNGIGSSQSYQSANNNVDVFTTFVATTTTTYITLRNFNVSTPALVDNISVKLADADRSVNNNGLIVNGTVTRTFVDEV